MKITKRQLRRIIREAVNPAFGPEIPLTPSGDVDIDVLTDEQLDHYEEGFNDAAEGLEPRDTMTLRRIEDKAPLDQMYDAGYSDGNKQAKHSGGIR